MTGPNKSYFPPRFITLFGSLVARVNRLYPGDPRGISFRFAVGSLLTYGAVELALTAVNEALITWQQSL